MRTPPRMRPVLNRQEEGSRAPRSLRAFPVQLNQGERRIEIAMKESATNGPATPQMPATFSHVPLELGKQIPNYYGYDNYIK